MTVNGGIKMDRGAIEIKTTRYITCDDVEKLTGKHWGDFEFAQMAGNDGYQILCCSDWSLEDLYEELKWEDGKEGSLTINDFDDEEDYRRYCRNSRACHLRNQIELVEILRKDYGIRDSILIYVSW